ncbi:MAG: cobaltochelatase CobT-related protein [Candidatus Brocadiia bacterium]
MNKLRPYLSGLLRRLVQTLRGRKEMRWQRGRSRGRLDPGALHRLSVGRSSRIFRKRKISEGGRTACTLLLDLSSSMDGDQIRMARRLALIFGEVLSRIGYPTEIIGFSTIDRNLRYEVSQQTGEPTEELAKKYTRMVPLYHALLKQFGEPWRRAAARMGSVRCQALTPLGESLLFAGKRLASRPEYRKALFCLTDGQPVVGAWDESVTMQHACRAVERLEGVAIEPVGIGIMADCVQKIFPRNAVIHRLEELPRTFAGELCEVLTERKRAGSA